MTSQKSAHDIFLEKVGSKIGAVARDGSFTKILPNFIQFPDNPSFLKPFKKRSLPVIAKKFQPTSALKKQLFDASSRILPHPAALETKAQTPHTVIIDTPREKMRKEQSLQNIPIPLKSISPIHQQFEVLYNQQPEETISGIERKEVKEEITSAASTGENYQIEQLILNKIRDSTCWDTHLLSELIDLVDPLYAVVALREDIGRGKGSKRRYSAAKSPIDSREDSIHYNFNPKLYNLDGPIASTGLFFTAADLKKTSIPIPVLEAKKEIGYAQMRKFSRPVSAISGFANDKSAASSRLASPKHYIKPPTPAKQDDNITTLFFSKMELSDDGDHMGWSNEEQIEDEQAPVSLVSSRVSTAKSKRRRFIPSYFPPADTKLGCLGPDLENDEHFQKMERVKKQKDYAEKVRQLAFKLKQDSLSEAEHPKTPKACTSKLPYVLTTKNMGQSQNELQLSAIVKRNKMYALQVKKPTTSSRRSVPSQRLPPINKRRNSDSPSPSANLRRLADEHINDMKVVEEIKRFYKN